MAVSRLRRSLEPARSRKGRPASSLPPAKQVAQELERLWQAVLAAPDEQHAVAALVEQICKTFVGCACAVRTIDPRSGRLTAAVARGPLAGPVPTALTISRAALGRAALGGTAISAANVTDSEPGRLFARTRAGACVPLVAEGELIGAIDLEPHLDGPALSAGQLRSLHRSAHAIALALRTIRELGELRSKERRDAELLDRANALVLVADGARRIRIFNEAFCRLSGYARQQVIGVDLLDLVVETDRKSVLKAVVSALRGRSIDRIELGLVTAAGGEVRIAMSTATLVAPDGAMDGVIAVGHDLTRLRDLERRFWQAEKLASVGKLATGIAHELSNPLTTIALGVETISRRLGAAPTASDEDRDLLRKIVEASDRLQRFSRDLLSYARPAPTRPELIDVPTLLRQAVEYCEIPIRQHRATVDVSCAESLPKLRGVRSNLMQVFVNLLTNACHALEGPGDIWLRATGEEGQLVIRVEDDGRGIPVESRERIFEPFFTTKGPGLGTGLGLAIVQGVVSSHGGTIEVSTREPHGTSFAVYLPAE
ncbi:MAG: ATP-binding protein [Deltaproteobacteria bacterium]